MKKTILQGKLIYGQKGENPWDVILIEEEREAVSVLLEELNEEIVSIKFYISDEPKTIDQLQLAVFHNLIGSMEAEYKDRYSDLTGYLWTDEKLNVGEHDLLSILESHVGKYIYLEADIADTK